MNWMLTIQGGPARGYLEVARDQAPFFLRVVKDASKKIDCLDQPGDQAEAGETVYVYRKVPGSEGTCHVRRQRRRGEAKGHSRYKTARYAYCPDQPAQELLRDEAAWHAWARERFEEERRHAQSVAAPGAGAERRPGGDRPGGAAGAADDPDRGR